MSSKTLKDVLIDLYHSGDLVPVWHDGDKRQCEDMRLSRVTPFMMPLAEWWLSQGHDLLVEAVAGHSEEIAEAINGGIFDLGNVVQRAICREAVVWTKVDDAWDEAKAHITELERSR